MSYSYNDILKFWFGDNLNNLQSENYIHHTKFWNKIDWNKDGYIRENFIKFYEAALNDELSDWLNDARGCLSLILLLDQFSKPIHRGKTEMYANDDKAIKISINLVNNNEKFQTLSTIEQYFVYLCLLHSEDISIASVGYKGIEELSNKSPSSHKKYYKKYFMSAKAKFGLLEKFGRYPFKNELLGRTSTNEELEFLKTTSNKYIEPAVKPNSVTLHDIRNAKENLNKRKLKADLPPQKLLFLHGYRQSSNKLKKRTRKLIRALEENCNSNIYFLNGTHAYKPENKENDIETNDNLMNVLESERVWYTSKCDSTVYSGIEKSIEYVFDHVKHNGPYDGIIGFSQGSTVASILLSRYPSLFRYFISIGGFPLRDASYSSLYSPDSPKDIPTLHIYGKNDKLIDPNLSIAFAKCFKNSTLVDHPAGHFAPEVWPNDKITNFVKMHAELKKLVKLDLNASFSDKIVFLNEKVRQEDFINIDANTLFISNWAKEFYNKALFCKSDFNNNNEIYEEFEQLIKNLHEESDYNDYLVLIFLFMKLKLNEENLKKILNLWLQACLLNSKYILTTFDSLFVKTEKWTELITLADCVVTKLNSGEGVSSVVLSQLYVFIIDKLANQLRIDLRSYDEKNSSNYTNEYITIKSTIGATTTFDNISQLALFIPRINSLIDKKIGLAHAVAYKLNSVNLEESDLKILEREKIICYNSYRKIISVLKTYHNNLKSDLLTNPRRYLLLAKHDKKVAEMLMSAPISNSIINPVPEPVDISTLEQLKPLYDWLSDTNSNLNDDLTFLKGKVAKDGRLDLCKQVIGPAGIEPLLKSLDSNKHIDRLLLGNNIVGDNGGKIIGDFIKSGKSPLKVWYIAGNDFTEVGIKPICEALYNDTQVTGLWLKRNPLKPGGMTPIAELLKNNSAIEVLDLMNCGILDEGVEILLGGLKFNKALKHLYLSANGITTVGLTKIKEYLESGLSNLETLFLGANRIGDEGAKILAEGLKVDKCLKRFNATSSRIGPAGMKYLAEAFEVHPNLELVDIGYLRSTMDIGELGNLIGDEGAENLANFIRKSTPLKSLNITHNHISTKGLEKIIDALEDNMNLIHFEYIQHSTRITEQMANKIRKYLNRNLDLIKTKEPNFTVEEFLIQDHVKKIYSIYRTH